MDVVRLLKTQDAGYLRVVIDKTRRELESLEGEVHLFSDDDDNSSATAAATVAGRARDGTRTGGKRTSGIMEDKGRHIIYVDSREEQRGFVPQDWFGTDKEGLGKTYNRPRVSSGMKQPQQGRKGQSGEKQREEQEDLEGKDEQKKRVEKWKARVEACRTRLRHLETAERELNLQRDRMSKTPTVGGVNKQGVKWRVRERKR